MITYIEDTFEGFTVAIVDNGDTFDCLVKTEDGTLFESWEGVPMERKKAFLRRIEWCGENCEEPRICRICGKPMRKGFLLECDDYCYCSEACRDKENEIFNEEDDYGDEITVNENGDEIFYTTFYCDLMYDEWKQYYSQNNA